MASGRKAEQKIAKVYIQNEVKGTGREEKLHKRFGNVLQLQFGEQEARRKSKRKKDSERNGERERESGRSKNVEKVKESVYVCR